METVAYFQLAQNYETSELQSNNATSFEGVKFTNKTMAGVVSLTGVALASGLLAAAPASAYYSSCCRPVVFQPVVFQPVVFRPIYYRPCSTSCYYPQAYSAPSYDHSYYSSYEPEESYQKEDCYSQDESYQEDDYQEVAYYPEDPNLLTIGSSGEIVAALQQVLLEQGFDPGAVDGLYGYQTAEAVAQYQAAAGLEVDGVAGGQTLDSLGLAGAGA